jgi:hypothetical protein
MTKIWLDDIRPAPPGWSRVDRVGVVKIMLSHETVHVLSLDHDLGEGRPTGYDLVKWMAETGHWPIVGIQIHSANPVGVSNMKATIERYAPRHIWNWF